jgi:hypothetical protein
MVASPSPPGGGQLGSIQPRAGGCAIFRWYAEWIGGPRGCTASRVVTMLTTFPEKSGRARWYPQSVLLGAAQLALNCFSGLSEPSLMSFPQDQ